MNSPTIKSWRHSVTQRTWQLIFLQFKALQDFVKSKPTGKLFDLLETGQIILWEIRKT